ncbi:hypothetical protein ACVDG3_19905 [Meridianimarinicoccus sp. RP-17]|uniref:hypothetical protein n=1 Tax=Meridianimarinicoccus zhengii TaxID=2056810 RepID=UPI000DAD3BD9|nr:hypothetical protein [Phycocomes zhengii]
MGSNDGIGTFEMPYDPSIRDGHGVFLLTQALVPETPFESDIEIVEKNRQPGQLNSKIRVCETKDSWKEVQEFGAKGDGSKDGVKVGAGFNTTFEHAVTDTSLLLVQCAHMATGSDNYVSSSVKLRQEAKDLLRKDPKAFVERFGTHFVGGRVLGAYFYGTLEIKLHEKSAKKEAAAKISGEINDGGKGDTPGGSGEASYGFSSETSAMIRSVDGELSTNGILPKKMNIDNYQTMRGEYSQFAQEASNSGAIIRYVCYPFSMLKEVSEILIENGQTLTSPIDSSLIQSICEEARETERALAEIGETKLVAEQVTELHEINTRYRNMLIGSKNSFGQLNPHDLSNVSEEIRNKVGLGTRAETFANETIAAWRDEFRAAYNDII